MPWATLRTPVAANPVAKTATAVELCSSTAIPVPINAAFMRPLAERLTAARSSLPLARSKPVLTMRTDHSRSTTAPATLINKSSMSNQTIRLSKLMITVAMLFTNT